ncbi:MAG: hypothetical protein JWM80_485, partial [Cyanobacteria bacterium RYN_339]|nr:hypothetical protein [Cyanobacteria bacterium RYN_339]
PQPQPQPQPAPHGHGPTNFVLSSFNVLGYSHTEKGGNKASMASGVQRIHTIIQLLDQHHVDVAGLQEFQSPQAKEFLKVAGNRYAVYPGLSLHKGDSQNSITWRKDKWDLVKAQTFTIPYFEGHAAKQPVVLLRNKETGQEAYFLNVHNPADTADHHHQQAYRTRSTQIEADLIARLRQSGLPVFMTGDLNEHESAFQRLQAKGALITGNDAKTRKHGIDWLIATPGVHFSNFMRDRSKAEAAASDHPMVAARVQIPG